MAEELSCPVLYPLTFEPIFKERVWGGRNLARLYQKRLPPGVLVGESWEITDRPEGASVIVNGPLCGKDLRWLMENQSEELLGSAASLAGRFPLLIKILDAQDKLSLQVHPPVSVAAQLGGEPKTELWYIAETRPDAEICAGLKRGVTRSEFERKIQDGTVVDCVCRIAVRAGDAMFLPGGRVHAIGAGNVIFEIQQNSDTTYRVFDWKRLGLDGKPRKLHIAQSLASIDFDDFEPSLIQNQWTPAGDGKRRSLVEDTRFKVDALEVPAGDFPLLPRSAFRIVGLLKGRLIVSDDKHSVELMPGQFCLLPAGLKVVTLYAKTVVTILQVQAG